MKNTDLKRRAFLRGKSPRFNAMAVRPPWSIETDSFINSCERCNQCIDSCPEEIIIKGDGGYPEVDFKQGSCTFCAKCVDACHTGSFQYFNSPPPHDICSEPVKAWIPDVNIKTSCLSLNAVVCRMCGDNCEEDAIQFRLQLGGISIPIIDNDKCTGCGECLYICPKDAISIKNRSFV